jgi:hypothetical protein
LVPSFIAAGASGWRLGPTGRIELPASGKQMLAHATAVQVKAMLAPVAVVRAFAFFL